MRPFIVYKDGLGPPKKSQARPLLCPLFMPKTPVNKNRMGKLEVAANEQPLRSGLVGNGSWSGDLEGAEVGPMDWKRDGTYGPCSQESA